MAVTGYAAQGTIPVPTSPYNRIAIVSSTNASPIVVTATGHGFNTGDSIEIEGHLTNTEANGQWQILVLDANRFSLLGSNGNGVGSATGYAIDYQVQPAYGIPAPGDPASMVTLGPVLEGLANPTPFLYRRAGKLRLYNQYFGILGAGNGAHGYYAGNTSGNQWPFNPTSWGSVTPSSPNGSFTLGPTATLQSLSDTPSLTPYFGNMDIIDVSMSFSMRAYGNINLTTPALNCPPFSVGISLIQGGSSVAYGAVQTMMAAASAAALTNNPYPPTDPWILGYSGTVRFTAGLWTPGSALSVGIGVVCESALESNPTIAFVGQWTIVATQYRYN